MRKTFHARTVVFLIVAAMALGSMLTIAYMEMIRTQFTVSKGADNVTVVDRETGVRNANGKDVSKEPAPLEWDKLNTVYRIIESSFYKEVSRDDLIDGAIRGMIAALDDPYTSYMNASEAKQFTATVDHTFSGIGAEVTMLDGFVTVVSAIKGSPAERAGIMAKDIILSVNDHSLEGLSLNEAVSKIRGPKGSQAKLKIQREGYETPIEVVVVRDDIDMETVFSRMEEDGIGVIELRQFVQNSDQRFIEEFDALKEQGLKALVIDVRNNPGGYLYSVIDLLDYLLPGGETIVQVQNREGEIEVSKASGEGVDLPIAVLINQDSASASEILAASLAENGRAKLFGVTSFGKGTVQSTFSKGFADGSEVKLTIAKWLTPDGHSVEQTGVTPDVEVQQPEYFSARSLPKDTVLQLNMNHADVANLQIMLDALGYEVDRKDGYFSQQTAEAVKQFQQDHQLLETGEVDQMTAEKLEDQLIELMQDPLNDAQLQAALEHLKQTLGIDS